MYFAEPEIFELEDVIPGEVPRSVRSLFFNLKRLEEPEFGAEIEDTLGIVYQAFMSEVDDKERQRIFLFVVQKIECGELPSAAMLPFITYETNHHLVKKAVEAYLQTRRGTLDDPVLAVREILDLMVSDLLANRGAAFAGLVCFGDRGVCAVLRTIRGQLALSDVRAFSHAVAGPLHRSTIEFCVDWIVDVADEDRYDIAIQVATALASLVVNDSILKVHESRFNFGPNAFVSSRHYPDATLQDVLADLRPILDYLSRLEVPALNRMIDILHNPAAGRLDQLDSRKVSTRRKNPDRRVSDRRIVNITPRIERRQEERRGPERRITARR